MRSLSFFSDWSDPTSYDNTITQSDGLESNIDSEALSSKDYHKYEPRRSRVSYFRDPFTTQQLFSFNSIINGGDMHTKWNQYKACIKDGDEILFRGVIDNTSVEYSKGKYECSFIIHDIITLLNEGLDKLNKSFTWSELSQAVDLTALLEEIIEDSLSYGDREMTPEDWYLTDFSIPDFSYNMFPVLNFDIDAFESKEGLFNLPSQYNLDRTEYTFRNDGDYIRLYCLAVYTGDPDPDDPPMDEYFKINVFVLNAGQAILDLSTFKRAPEGVFDPDNHGYTTDSGFYFHFPTNLNVHEITDAGLTYYFDVNTGILKADGTAPLRYVFLSKEGAKEPVVNETDNITTYMAGGKSFSYRELFKFICYLWNLSVTTNKDGVINITVKDAASLNPQAEITISDSDLHDTKFSALLYSIPKIDDIFKPLKESGLNLAIKAGAEDYYKDIYGTKIVKTTVPTSYNLFLNSTVNIYGDTYKIAKIKKNKDNTFFDIEGWSE